MSVAPEEPYSEYLFRAVDDRLDTMAFRKACLGGWFLADMPASPTLPYAVFLPMTEKTTGYTTRRKFVKVTYGIQIATKTFADGQAVLKALYKAIQNAPLTFPTVPGLSLTLMRPGDIEYGKEDEEWTAVAIFEADMQQEINHNPS